MKVLSRFNLSLLAVVILAGGTSSSSLGATITVTRGPYLQLGTTNGVTIRWRTDVASDSLVRYGTNAGAFIGTNSHPAVTNEHAVAVTGLRPGTKYFYEFGSTTGWFSGDANDFFTTSPPAGSTNSTRIWVLGDSGTANADAAAVRDAYLAYAVNRPADLLVMLGDNAYNNGTDAEYQNAVFNMYPAVLQNTVLWSTIGNHDTAQSSNPSLTIPYFSIFTLPLAAESGGVASGTEKYYSFDYANIHFVCLDSMSSDRSASGPMSTWLRADLEATTQPWIIAFWHHPSYTKGSHDSDTETELIQMRQNMLPILESHGVDLVLCGHSHSYERSFLLDGHYGTSGTLTQSMKRNGGDGREGGDGAYAKSEGAINQGAVYAVCGSSGKVSGGTLNHPAMFLSLNSLGSLIIDVTGNRLDLVFLKSDATVGDSCTILKTPPATSPPAAPSSLAATPVSSSQINLAWLDNATDEDGFKIERSSDGINYGQFATVGANVTSGADTGLSQSTTYFYRVRAFNTAGDSVHANVAQATTLSGPVIDTLVPVGSVWRYLDNGLNQGTNWSAPGFNDSSWSSGPAELGYGDGGEATVVSYGPNSSSKYITTYFRREFSVANPTAYTNAIIRLLRDDGAVIYLNGREILRSNMPGGAISHTTLASAAVAGADESTFYLSAISPTNLLPGVNLLAVEIHQSAANSSDLGFNLELTASGPPPSSGDITPPSAVANLTVSTLTGDSVTLLWTAPGDDGAAGTAASYDVRYSTSPIIEASWSIASPATGEPAPAAAGNSQAFTVNGLAAGVTYYFALKSSDEVGNTSPLSNVPGATTPIAPPAAPGDLIANPISSARIDLVWTDNANNEAGFEIERSTDGVAFAQLATAGANATGYSDNAVAAATRYFYRVRAYNSGGDSADSNIAQASTPAAPVQTVLIPTSATWRYLDNGSDQGAAWRAPAFDDSSWAAGVAQLGYGDGDEATLIGFGPDANNKYITTCFRHSFQAANVGAVTNLQLRLLRDDGAVVYLNGVEVFRSNLPGGAVTYVTLASAAIGGADESTFYPASMPAGILVNGANVLAVEIHQANSTSSDLSFALELVATAAPSSQLPAEAPGSLAATTVSATQIDLSWADNSSNEDGFRIERKTGSSGAYAEIASVGADVINFSDTTAVASTAYYYRVRARNAAGDSAYSNEVSATTPEPPDTIAPVAVGNLAVGFVSSNAVTLTWTAPGDDGNSGTAAVYDLRYSTTPMTESGWDSATQASGEPAPLVAGSSQLFTIGGLSTETTLYFALKSADEAGNVGPLSNLATVTTLPVGLPGPWLSQDVGAVAATGSASWSNDVFTVRGSGADIAGRADEFRFVFQAANGDCEIRARVTGVQNTHSSAKAGVMIRESLNGNSRHATMVLTPGNALSFRRRSSTGGTTSSTSGGSATTPYWVRVVRAGNTFTASKSANGTTWTTVGSANITMGASVQIGLVVTSRSDGTLNTSTFDNVTATP